MTDLFRFRTGRHLGRTVYIQAGAEPDRDIDELIGCMDSPELGRIAATALDLFYHQSKRNRAQLEAAISELRSQRRP